jgi:hypothetical protein
LIERDLRNQGSTPQGVSVRALPRGFTEGRRPALNVGAPSHRLGPRWNKREKEGACKVNLSSFKTVISQVFAQQQEASTHISQ